MGASSLVFGMRGGGGRGAADAGAADARGAGQGELRHVDARVRELQDSAPGGGLLSSRSPSEFTGCLTRWRFAGKLSLWR